MKLLNIVPLILFALSSFAQPQTVEESIKAFDQEWEKNLKTMPPKQVAEFCILANIVLMDVIDYQCSLNLKECGNLKKFHKHIGDKCTKYLDNM